MAARTPIDGGLRPQRTGRRRQPVRHAGGRAQPRRRRQRLHVAASAGARRPRQPGHRHRLVPRHARGRLRRVLRHRVVHRARAPRRASATAGCSRASDGRSSTSSATGGPRPAGTSTPIPGLDDARRRSRPSGSPTGWRRSAARRRCRSSPARCGGAGRRRRRWPRGGRVTPIVEPAVAEIPSPPGVPMGERVAWLRAGDGRDVGGPRRRATRRTATASSRASPRSAPTPSSCRTSSPSTP